MYEDPSGAGEPGCNRARGDRQSATVQHGCLVLAHCHKAPLLQRPHTCDRMPIIGRSFLAGWSLRPCFPRKGAVRPTLKIWNVSAHANLTLGASTTAERSHKICNWGTHVRAYRRRPCQSQRTLSIVQVQTPAVLEAGLPELEPLTLLQIYSPTMLIYKRQPGMSSTL